MEKRGKSAAKSFPQRRTDRCKEIISVSKPHEPFDRSFQPFSPSVSASRFAETSARSRSLVVGLSLFLFFLFFSYLSLSLSLSLSSSFTSFLLRGSRALCKTSSALRSSRARENVHRPKRYRARPYLFPSAHPRTGPMFRRSSRFLVSFPCCFCPHRDHRRSDKRSRSDFSRRLGKQVTEKHLFLIFRFLRVYRVKFSKPIP